MQGHPGNAANCPRGWNCHRCGFWRGAVEGGDGVARNAVEAVKWYEKSSRTFVNAAEALARIYEEGRDGVPKDSAKAACWRRNFNERAAR